MILNYHLTGEMQLALLQRALFCRISRRLALNLFLLKLNHVIDSTFTAADKDKEIRERALKIVRSVRASEAYTKHVEQESGVRRPKRIRKFLKPLLNLECKRYTDMVQTMYQVPKIFQATHCR